MSGPEIPTTDLQRGELSTSDAAPATNPWAAAASRALHPSACRTTAPTRSESSEPATADQWIWAIASGLAEVTVPWDLRGEESPTPGERHWELALATPEYEVWTIYWPPGTGIDLHDHGSSAGAFCVVAGELLETVVSESGVVEHRDWSRGEGTHFAAGHAHQVVNSGRSTATSVHVYSPPLTAMTYYDGADEVGRSTLRDAVAPGEGDPR